MTYTGFGTRPASQITAAFPVWNRPAYLERVLGAWSRVRGVDEVVLEFHCEPGCPEAVELCREVKFAERYVYVNPRRLGHAWNVHKSMHWAFRNGAGYVIQALDDYLPSTDLLELHHWHRRNYATDPTVLGLRSGTDYERPPPDGDPMGAVWRTQLIGALTGFHKAKWQRIAPWWELGEGNWWQWINEGWLQSGPRLDVLAPAVSRCEDIGAVGSDGAPDPVASSPLRADVPQQQYFEVQGLRERATGFQRYMEEWEA